MKLYPLNYNAMRNPSCIFIYSVKASPRLQMLRVASSEKVCVVKIRPYYERLGGTSGTEPESTPDLGVVD